MKSLIKIKWCFPVSVIVFAMIMTAFGFQSNKAYADADSIPIESSSSTIYTSMGNLNWPDLIAANNALHSDGTSVEGGLPKFSYSQSSYIVVGLGSETCYENVMEIIAPMDTPSTTDPLVLYTDGSLHDAVETKNNSPMYQGIILDNPNINGPGCSGAKAAVYSWGTQDGRTSIEFASSNASLQLAQIEAPTYTPDLITVHNVEYDGTWLDGWNGTPGTLGFGTGNGGTYSGACSGWYDIPCELSNIFSSIGTTIGSAIEGLITFIADVFMPSGQQLSADWSGFSSNMESHLGFLLWPFTFIGQLYTALTSPSSSDCNLTGATFFGRTMPSIDLCAPETSLGSLWTYMTYLVRAVLIVGLFFYLKNKFQEIATK